MGRKLGASLLITKSIASSGEPVFRRNTLSRSVMSLTTAYARQLTPYAQSLVGPIHDVLMRIDSAIATEPAFDPASSQRHFSMTLPHDLIRVFFQDVLVEVHRGGPAAPSSA